MHNKISNSNTKYRVTEQKFTEKFQILFCCFKFCSAVSNSVLLFQILFCCLKFCSAVSNSVLLFQILFCCFKFCSAVSNSVLLFGPEVMRKLDFIIYDNCNISLKFIQIFSAKYIYFNLQNKMSARKDA